MKYITMIKHAMNFCVLMMLLGITASQPAFAEADKCCIFMSQATLKKIRTQLKHGDAAPNTKVAYHQLLSDADKALSKSGYSVTKKGLTPPSGDKHDYMSIAVYTWPNPNKKNGLPWITKDGQINPATKNNQTDAARFSKFTHTVHTLALAGFLSGNEKYNQKAAALLRMWFIAPETRMNPHLKFSQSIPGIVNGRPEGVLDGRYLATHVVDSVLLLQQSSSWHSTDDAKMTQWMSKYFNWLTTSQFGKKAGSRANNHGTWYNLQVAGIARYLGKDDAVQTMLQKTKKMIDGQIAANGSQPLELQRTRSFHYSIFNLQPMVMLAILAKQTGTDLWHYKSPKGGSILKAVDYMAPYANPSRSWPHKTSNRASLELIPLLIMTDNSLKTHAYKKLIEHAHFNKVPPEDIDTTMGSVKTAQKESWLIRLPNFMQE